MGRPGSFYVHNPYAGALLQGLELPTPDVDMSSQKESIEESYAKMFKSYASMIDTADTMMTVDAWGSAISQAVELYVQADLADRQMGLEERKMDLAEDVAQHRMGLEEKAVDISEKAMVLKKELAENLAHTQKDLQVELAKIQSDAKVQIASKMATKQLFLQTRNYGTPVSV